ncbi:MAG: PAS domain-containing sensor histidine kinase [Rhodospirillales bacterium]|nr:PAS domain-containing sensor histidine kinase [Rhodospirillales bacterium]
MIGIETLLYPALGAGAALTLGAPFVLYLKRASGRADAEARTAAEDADRARALLAACPDASFVFEGGSGTEFCSRRLARLLDLGADGNGLRFADVLAALAPGDAETLARATDRLRCDGTVFETVMVKNNAVVAVAGTRARDGMGGTVADSLWFRPIPEAAGVKTPAPPSLSLPAASESSRQQNIGGGDSPAAPADKTTAEVLEALAQPIALFAADGRLAACNWACARLWRIERAWLETGPALGEILEALRARRRLPEASDFHAYKAEQMALLGLTAPAPPTMMYLPDDTVLSLRAHPRSGGGAIFVYEDVTGEFALKSSLKTATRVQDVTLDNLHEGVAVFGGDGRLKLANREVARLWNLNPDTLAASAHLADFIEAMRPFRQDVEDWPLFSERLAGRLLSRRRGSGRIERSDDTVIDYATVPLPDGAVLLGYLDATDTARREESLLERALAFEEAARLKSQFITNVSHEIRTPLTSVIGFAEILAAGHFGALTPRQMDYAQNIFDSANGLMTVVGDILDLASIEAGALELQLDAVDVHAMLVSVLGLVRERARRKELRLEFDAPTDIGWIQADQSRLKQVLFHLLSNAIAFTPPRGGVRLLAARAGDEVELAVADTGVGIPLADQERVQRPFEKVVPIRAGGGALARAAGAPGTSGAGLGLTLVRRLIELHQGRVELKSVPNRGTTVTCWLPAGGAKARDAFQA